MYKGNIVQEQTVQWLHDNHRYLNSNNRIHAPIIKAQVSLKVVIYAAEKEKKNFRNFSITAL